ncbi:MAG: DNA repair protein RecO [Vampirovibrionales bacterium]|nr:DNA repair protein RecO [Vampirovibrionales bacterium]
MQTLSAHQLLENKQYTTRAYCLKSWPYGEADRIVHFFSADFGKISAIAKGVKKATSKLAGACELLHLSSLQLSRGKNLDLLQQYQSIQSFSGIRTDILKLAYAQVFAELVYVLVSEFEPDSAEIFELLTAHLTALEQSQASQIAPISMRFQLKILETAGYLPSLVRCVLSDEALQSEALYYPFSVPLGGAVLSRDTMLEHLPPGAGSNSYNIYTQDTYTWVNVSSKTLFGLQALLRQPLEMTTASADAPSFDIPKAQKFLQFYIAQKLEHRFQSFDFLMSVLT